VNGTPAITRCPYVVELSDPTAQARWKVKYLDALDAHEQIERDAGVRVNELGTLIARLSRTLPGKENAGVQKRLGTLAEALKRKPLDRSLSRDVNDVHARVLDVMDVHVRERTDVMTALQQAALQLEKLCATRKLRGDLKQFIASLAQPEAPPISALFEEFGALQGQILDLAAGTKENHTSASSKPQVEVVLPSIPSRVDSVASMQASHQVAVQVREQPVGTDGSEHNLAVHGGVVVDWLAAREILAQLLAQLPITVGCKEQVLALHARIAHALDESSLIPVLEQLRELFEASLTAVDVEFRSFLDSVDQRLDTLLSTIGQAREQEHAALTREQGLSESFQARLDSMRGDVQSATNLDILKTSIDGHLETLVRSMQDIHDDGRFASGERDSRLTVMAKRLQELEDESTQVRSQLETQRQLARTDALTGLANRKAFDERISEEITLARQRETPLALAIADIDHFKRVNDTYGHPAGDRALALFARILRTRVRATDFCARYGGEEFVMMFPATNAAMAAKVVQQVREFVESCGFSYKGEPVPLTASFGVTEYRREDDSAMMLERADKAMYEAKSNGRNRVRIAQA
jgi:diguanylate cyclase (GGDEF)-like protein